MQEAVFLCFSHSGGEALSRASQHLRPSRPALGLQHTHLGQAQMCGVSQGAGPGPGLGILPICAGIVPSSLCLLPFLPTASCGFQNGPFQGRVVIKHTHTHPTSIRLTFIEPPPPAGLCLPPAAMTWQPAKAPGPCHGACPCTQALYKSLQRGFTAEYLRKICHFRSFLSLSCLPLGQVGQHPFHNSPVCFSIQSFPQSPPRQPILLKEGQESHYPCFCLGQAEQTGYSGRSKG